jgi:riboflavin synthase
MFTGLVEKQGTLAARTPRGKNAEVVVRASFQNVTLGESIAVDGCCLTVRAFTADTLTFDVSTESLERTTLGDVTVGGSVNLERAMAVGSRFGGHVVSGHVDGTGSCAKLEAVDAYTRVTFSFPKALSRFIAEKGSITINGVSLTVNHVGAPGDPTFSVMLIPHTQEVTTLGLLRPGSRVNLEVDLFARYVARMLDVDGKNATNEDAWAARLSRFAEKS